MSVASYGGARYSVTLLDDSTSVSLVRFLARKPEAQKAVQDRILQLENSTASRVKPSRSENRAEFISDTLKKCLEVKGIQHSLRSPYSPQSNGKVERLNRTLNDMARAMIISLSSTNRE